MKSTVLFLSLFLISISSFSAEPNCYSSGYCSYTGKIHKIYINESELILVYFDTDISQSEIDESGFSGVSKDSAAAYDMKDSPEFAKLFYSTALAAQATNRDVIIHMDGVESGYLRFDRIWLKE